MSEKVSCICQVSGWREELADQDFQLDVAGIGPAPWYSRFNFDGRLRCDFDQLPADGEGAGSFGHEKDDLHRLDMRFHSLPRLQGEVDQFKTVACKQDPAIEPEGNARGGIEGVKRIIWHVEKMRIN